MILTPDEALEMADTLADKNAAFKQLLADKQPRTTREQWMALDCLRDAEAHLRSYAAWLSR